MFEDQTTQAAPPNNLPSEPVDMFAGVDNGADNGVKVPSTAPDALDVGLLKRKEAPPEQPVNNNQNASSTTPQVEAMPPTDQQMYKVKEPVLGKIIVGVVLLVVLAGVGYAGWWGYNKYFVEKEGNTTIPPVTTTNNQSNDLPPVIEENPPVDNFVPTSTNIPAEMNNDNILFGQTLDTDEDGLDDVREKELGTDSNLADTDNDDLSDSDEVIIWKTNPLNPDTDGDSFLDGEEVKNAYNPLGTGKLFGPVTDSATITPSSTADQPTTSTLISTTTKKVTTKK